MKNILISAEGRVKIERNKYVAGYYEIPYRNSEGRIKFKTYKLIIHNKKYAIYIEVENE